MKLYLFPVDADLKLFLDPLPAWTKADSIRRTLTEYFNEFAAECASQKKCEMLSLALKRRSIIFDSLKSFVVPNSPAPYFVVDDGDLYYAGPDGPLGEAFISRIKFEEVNEDKTLRKLSIFFIDSIGEKPRLAPDEAVLEADRLVNTIRKRSAYAVPALREFSIYKLEPVTLKHASGVLSAANMEHYLSVAGAKKPKDVGLCNTLGCLLEFGSNSEAKFKAGRDSLVHVFSTSATVLVAEVVEDATAVADSASKMNLLAILRPASD